MGGGNGCGGDKEELMEVSYTSLATGAITGFTIKKNKLISMKMKLTCVMRMTAPFHINNFTVFQCFQVQLLELTFPPFPCPHRSLSTQYPPTPSFPHVLHTFTHSLSTPSPHPPYCMSSYSVVLSVVMWPHGTKAWDSGPLSMKKALSRPSSSRT